jgi:hypothetical protein
MNTESAKACRKSGRIFSAKKIRYAKNRTDSVAFLAEQ